MHNLGLKAEVGMSRIPDPCIPAIRGWLWIHNSKAVGMHSNLVAGMRAALLLCMREPLVLRIPEKVFFFCG